MQSIYTISLHLYNIAIFLARPFNKKAAQWWDGRKALQRAWKTALPAGEKRVWFHCASLGEFEQGRPVMEAFREAYPSKKIVLSFFSPSGYEIRKNYTGADYVVYMPLDTPKNAQKFINWIQPELVFFVKYELWFHHLSLLKKRNIPCMLFAAHFHKQHIYFKPYGGFFRKTLALFNPLFVQNEASIQLLQGTEIEGAILGGDTRFDRVLQISKQAKKLELIEQFIGANDVFVAGSTWSEDEKLLAEVILQSLDKPMQWIIAPHEISEKKLLLLEAHLQGHSIRFSKWKKRSSNTLSPKVLIIDNIGMLSSIYAYGKFAYIGGGFGAGIHNVLEAVVHGSPTFIGPNYQRFKEAKELVDLAGIFVVENSGQLNEKLGSLCESSYYHNTSKVCKDYVVDNVGATEKVMDWVSDFYTGGI